MTNAAANIIPAEREEPGRLPHDGGYQPDLDSFV